MTTYRGYTISRVAGSGYWRATRVDSLPLVADTRDGIREIIRHYPNGR